jgi:hypothetical protein
VAQLFSLGIIAMTHILKSDRWLGYAALVLAAVVILTPFIFRRDALVGFIDIYCLGPVGLYLSIRGLFVGHLPCRICAGLALVVFGWLLYSLIVTFSSVRIHT